MTKPRVSTSTLVFLLGGLGFAAVSAMVSAGHVSAIPVISGLLAWLADVAGNRVADVMGQDLDSAEAPAEEIFRNHHIVELVGHSITSVARAYVLNQPQFHTCRGEIESAAKQAPAAWLKFIRAVPPGFEPLREVGLPDVLRDFAIKDGNVSLLEPEDWKVFLHSFTDLPDGGCSLTPEALNAFADALHLHLAESLWNWVKRDFTSDGNAYVATEMLFLSRILQAVEDLRKQSPALTAQSWDALKLKELLDTGAKHQADLIQRLDEKQTKFFVKLFAQNGELQDLLLQQEKHFQRLPAEVADRVVAALKKELAAKGLKPADLSQEQLESELASRIPNLKPQDLHRLIGYALFKAYISRFDIIKYAPVELIGREAETKLLNDTWDQAVHDKPKRPHILTFVALGGEGKTSLVAKWAAELAHQDWPGCDAVFAWSFYSQGAREQTAVSSDLFLAEALTFFGDVVTADSAQGAFDKGRRLAQLVSERRALVILDGVEPLQYAPTSPTPGELRDQGLAALLKGLAATSHGLCVITTRYAIADLRAYWQTTAPVHELPRLSTAAGVRLLRTIGVKTGSQNEFEKLIEDVDGHALTLQILGQFLVRAFHGDVRCRDRVKLEKADAKIQGGHAFRAVEAYAKWLENDSDEARRELALLKLLGLFDRPASADCVNALRQAPAITDLTEPLVGLAEDDLEFSLSSLRETKLLTVDRVEGSGELIALDAHPLLREYFAKHLREQHPKAWRTAHRRLYEYLCVTTPDKPKPTREDLEPLYQAVVHGCEAGKHGEVFEKVLSKRICIRTGGGSRTSLYLGAHASDLCAFSAFFTVPWTQPVENLGIHSKAGILNWSGIALRALGRFREARQAMNRALEIRVKRRAFGPAAINARNLAEICLALGEVHAAIEYGNKGVVWADGLHGSREFVLGEQYEERLTLGNALHRAGNLPRAERVFGEARHLLSKLVCPVIDGYAIDPIFAGQPGYPYFDFLLTVGAVTEAEREAEKAYSFATQEDKGTPLDIGLAGLARVRAAIKRHELGEHDAIAGAEPRLSEALQHLREAGFQEYVVTGLLARAALWRCKHRWAEATVDLLDVYELCEPSGMLLNLTDLFLEVCRLHLTARKEQKMSQLFSARPWPPSFQNTPDDFYRKAELLVKKTGYRLRERDLQELSKQL